MAWKICAAHIVSVLQAFCVLQSSCVLPGSLTVWCSQRYQLASTSCGLDCKVSVFAIEVNRITIYCKCGLKCRKPMSNRNDCISLGATNVCKISAFFNSALIAWLSLSMVPEDATPSKMYFKFFCYALISYTLSDFFNLEHFFIIFMQGAILFFTKLPFLPSPA